MHVQDSPPATASSDAASPPRFVDRACTLPFDPLIDLFERDVDRSLFERTLKMSFEQRIHQLEIIANEVIEQRARLGLPRPGSR